MVSFTFICTLVLPLPVVLPGDPLHLMGLIPLSTIRRYVFLDSVSRLSACEAGAPNWITTKRPDLDNCLN